LDESFAELLHKQERHVWSALVEVDGAVDVERNSLVVTLHAGGPGMTAQSDVEQADLSRGADVQRASKWIREGDQFVG
jgi:hypothetical protein